MTLRSSGADHDQLAVRHVDHAHQPVGDGEPQRGEQQDGAERDAGERKPEAFAPDEPSLDRPQARLRCGADLGVGFAAPVLLRERQEQRLGVRISGSPERADRREARASVAAFQLDRGRDQLEPGLDRRIGLALDRLADERQERGVGAVLQRLGRLEARSTIGRNEPESSQGRIDFAPQPVVDDDVLAFPGQGPDFLAGDGVDALLPGDDQNALAGGLDGAVGERLKQRGSPLVARGDEHADCVHFFVALSERQRFDETRVDRDRRARGEAQRKHQHPQDSMHLKLPKRRRRFRAAAISDITYVTSWRSARARPSSCRCRL